MSDLLNHPLIKQYFSCPWEDSKDCVDPCNHLANRVLAAMQQPIRKGERFIRIGIDGPIEEMTAWADLGFSIHPQWLRLPDKFQPQQKKECCDYAKGEWTHDVRAGKIILTCMDCMAALKKSKNSWDTGDPVNERKECQHYVTCENCQTPVDVRVTK